MPKNIKRNKIFRLSVVSVFITIGLLFFRYYFEYRSITKLSSWEFTFSQRELVNQYECENGVIDDLDDFFVALEDTNEKFSYESVLANKKCFIDVNESEILIYWQISPPLRFLWGIPNQRKDRFVRVNTIKKYDEYIKILPLLGETVENKFWAELNGILEDFEVSYSEKNLGFYFLPFNSTSISLFRAKNRIFYTHTIENPSLIAESYIVSLKGGIDSILLANDIEYIKIDLALPVYYEIPPPSMNEY